MKQNEPSTIVDSSFLMGVGAGGGAQLRAASLFQRLSAPAISRDEAEALGRPRLAPHSARGRGRLCGLRRGGQFCGRSGRVSWARGRRHACSARRVALLYTVRMAACHARLPRALAPRGRQVRRVSRWPGGLGSLGTVGARQHLIGAVVGARRRRKAEAKRLGGGARG